MGSPEAKDAAPADGVSERDYAALLATLAASARGRGFLAEYGRRQRIAETQMLLAALARLEAMVAAQQPAPAEPAPEPPSVEPPPAETLAEAPLAQPAVPPGDAYARLMLLSEEERIALFS
jgi:hypothetical protein